MKYVKSVSGLFQEISRVENSWEKVHKVHILHQPQTSTKPSGPYPNDLASLTGTRMMLASELPEGRRFDEPPPEVRAATSEYRAEMDLLAQFIEECCVLNSNAVTKAADLYASYTKWVGADSITQHEFGRRLTERGFTRGKATGGARVWRGIGLIDDHKDDVDRRGT